MPACGRLSASTRRTPSSIATTADLLSAPRIVPPAFRTTPSSTTGSSGPDGGTVSRCAQKKSGVAGGRRLEPHVDVAHRRADLGAAAVLVRLEAEIAQIAQDDVGDGALLARRARDRGELEKQLEGAARRTHASILRSGAAVTCRRGPHPDRPPRRGDRRWAGARLRRRRRDAVHRGQRVRLPDARGYTRDELLALRVDEVAREPDARRSTTRCSCAASVTATAVAAREGRDDRRLPATARRRRSSPGMTFFVSVGFVAEELSRDGRTASARAARARSSAAPTKPWKSGAGRVGRDLNSGWNWLATNHGWSGSSTISTSRPSSNVPQTTRPASTSCSR